MNRNLTTNLVTILVGLGCALFISPGVASDTDPDKNQMWNRTNMPILFYLGKSELTVNKSAVKISNQDLKVAANLWNTDVEIKSVITDPTKSDSLYRFAKDLRCVKGDNSVASTGCSSVVGGRDNNKLNEIHFGYWYVSPTDDAETVAKTRRSSVGFVDRCSASGDCSYQSLKEVDIFFNFNKKWTNKDFSGQCSDQNWQAALVEDTLLHELGHAMGLKDYSPPFYSSIPSVRLMNEEGSSCLPKHPNYITEADWDAMRFLYGKARTTPVSISSPIDGSYLYAGQPFDFVASSPAASSQNQIQSANSGSSAKSTTNQIEWFSDLDGHIGTGGSISVDQLSPGVHFVKAQIGEPGGSVFGSDVVSINVVDQYFTDDADRFHPLPCVRIAGDPNDNCLIKFTQNIIYGECLPFPYYATLDVFDLNKNKSVAESFNSRLLSQCNDFQEDIFSWYFMLNGSSDNSKVRATFKLFNQGLCTFSSSLCLSATYTALVHIVDASIDLEPIDSQCFIRLGETHCSVNLQWSNHFWAPDSAVFYRPVGAQNWIHLQDLGVSAGEVDLPPFVDELGADLAIFQYKNGIGTVINAKTGLLAGPFRVYGRSDIDPPFMGQTVIPFLTYYSGDKDQDAWNVLDNGTTLNLYGNTWKAIRYDYVVGASTWLSFDYRSIGVDSPEIAGIALLDANDIPKGKKAATFQVDGTQDYGNQWYHRYFNNGWKPYDINVGLLMKRWSSYDRSIKYLGFLGDIDANNKQIDISYRNVKLYNKPVKQFPQWGHSGNWYDPDTSGQGIAMEVNPITEAIVVQWFTYAEDGSDKGASYNRWYLKVGAYDPNSITEDEVTLNIYETVGGRFNRSNVVTQRVVGTATLRYFDCQTAHLEYDFDYGYNSGRHGYIPLKRIIANIDCSIDEYHGPHKSDFGYTGNWYDPATDGQGFAFEVNPKAGVIVAQWFTYLPGNSSNLNNPNRLRWFTIVGSYTPGSDSSNTLTIYQNKGGELDGPNPTTETVVGTAQIDFHSCTSATIDFNFTGANQFKGLSGSINLVRALQNVTCE